MTALYKAVKIAFIICLLVRLMINPQKITSIPRQPSWCWCSCRACPGSWPERSCWWWLLCPRPGRDCRQWSRSPPLLSPSVSTMTASRSNSHLTLMSYCGCSSSGWRNSRDVTPGEYIEAFCSSLLGETQFSPSEVERCVAENTFSLSSSVQQTKMNSSLWSSNMASIYFGLCHSFRYPGKVTADTSEAGVKSEVSSSRRSRSENLGNVFGILVF